MIWYIISAIAFSAAVVLLVTARVREGRYLKKKASETMRQPVLNELEEEDRVIYERRKKFEQALKSAKGVG